MPCFWKRSFAAIEFRQKASRLLLWDRLKQKSASRHKPPLFNLKIIITKILSRLRPRIQYFSVNLIDTRRNCLSMLNKNAGELKHWLRHLEALSVFRSRRPASTICLFELSLIFSPNVKLGQFGWMLTNLVLRSPKISACWNISHTILATLTDKLACWT